MSNIIQVHFDINHRAWTNPVWRQDYGHILQFPDLELPTAYEVHFSNTPENAGTAITQIGNADGVPVPNSLLISGAYCYAWIFLHTGDNDGETMYMVTMPVMAKPTVDDEEPTPQEASAITQAIIALNDAVEAAQEAVEHYPKIVAGYWYVWDADEGDFVNTGIKAEGTDGADGVGIASAVLNADYTLTLTFTDGNSYTTPSIRGAQGAAGPAGNGIASTVLNADYTLTITYTNGNSYTTPSIRGAQGATGATGNGIASIYKTGTSGNVDTYTILYTNGNTDEFTVTNGSVTSVAGKTGAVTLDADDVAYDATDTYAAGTVGKELSDVNGALTNIQNGTNPDIMVGKLEGETVIEQVPYLFRKSPERVGKAVDKIVGGSVVFNQMIENGNFANTDGWYAYSSTISVADNVLSATSPTGGSYFGFRESTGSVTKSGHKYYVTIDAKSSVSGITVYAPYYNTDAFTNSATYTQLDTSWKTLARVLTGTGENAGTYIGLRKNTGSYGSEVTLYARNAMLVDLTQMFGATVADFIATLSTENAIKFLKPFFSKPYYAYTAQPTFKHVSSIASKEVVGLNQCSDKMVVGTWWANGVYQTGKGNQRAAVEHKINVIPGENYCLYWPDGTNGTNYIAYWHMFDDNDNFIGVAQANIGTDNMHVITVPDGCSSIAIAVYSSVKYAFGERICVSVSNDEYNGTYEPYKHYVYPLDSDVTLYGFPKLDANNNLYFDGDTYESDGTVTHYYALRAYQAGDESDSSVITDGTNTLYKLTTPTTETADAFTNPQNVFPDGTEAYNLASDAFPMPVGHYTEYIVDEALKVKGLPWDFSQLLAYTEVSTTATKAYSAGDYFILNNVLYKVTASIANGGTITPNTNCTATTIMAEIQAL